VHGQTLWVYTDSQVSFVTLVLFLAILGNVAIYLSGKK
jgi:hypothetical protein